MNNKNEFSSSDFYLSAFLLANSLNLINIDFSNPRRAVFVFEITENIDNLIVGFWSGKFKIEPLVLITSIKTLKQRLYSIKNEYE